MIMNDQSMTIEKCYEICSSNNYKYSGVQVLLFQIAIIYLHVSSFRNITNIIKFILMPLN